MSLVKSGRIKPSRAIGLGCGVGANAIYLAQNGFEVTGVDHAKAAIEKARAKAKESGIRVNFIVDDLSNPHLASGKFDCLLDFGTLSLEDLRLHLREPYLCDMLTPTEDRNYLKGFTRTETIEK